jgi:putative ABC transport system permease protein
MTLTQDIRYGIRVLMKSPGFVIAAVLSLALGIGANTTIFTMVNSVFLTPLPVDKPSELIYVFGTDSNNATNVLGAFLPISYPNFTDYRQQNDVFVDTGAYSYPLPASLAGGEKPTPVMGQLVSGNYFGLLGVHITVGRAFLPEEDQTPGANAVAVLNHKFWQRRFGGDSAIVGQTIRLNGHPFTVIGVAPAGFEGTIGVISPDFWAPVMSHPFLVAGSLGVDKSRRLLFFNVFGRLKPSVTIGQARASLETIGKRLEQEYPVDNKGRSVGVLPLREATIPPTFRSIVMQGSVLLTVIVGLVLLIACANLANLMLARANARRREFTVRIALGSKRSRLIWQLLTESILVALPGGVLALIIAAGGRNLILSFLPAALNANINMSIDTTVLVFTFVISILSGVVFGLLPALRASKPDLVTELKERAGSSAPAGRFNSRNILVFFQVALSVVALVSAGLFIRSLSNAQKVDLGFQKDNLIVAGYDLTSNGYDEGRGRQFHKLLVDRMKSVPGVASVTLAAAAPLTPAFQRSVFPEAQENVNSPSGVLVFTNSIVPGYFETMRMPLLKGRDFDDSDREDGMRVAIINDTMAKKFWPNQDALGKRFKFYGDTEFRMVVGIARTSKYVFIGEDPQSMAYLPLDQMYSPTMALHVRVNGQPESLKGTVERELRALDRDVAVNNVMTGPELLDTSLFSQRMSATLLSIFGVIALVLAAVGIYGVMSYSVSQRGPEIGIRMALGADRQKVMRMVLQQGMKVVAVGLATGLVLGLGVSQLMSRLLYGVGTGDIATFGTTAAVLFLVALIANYLPARRATRVDPVTVMRSE